MSRAEAFWNASASWTQARVGSQAFKKQLTRQQMVADLITAGKGKPKWASAAVFDRYNRIKTLSAGSIQVDPALLTEVRRMAVALAPELEAAFDEHMGGLAFDAWRAWPVDTGLSRALLSLEFSLLDAGSSYKGSIFQRAPYVFFIKGQPHRKLLDNPGRDVAHRIATQALEAVERAGRA